MRMKRVGAILAAGVSTLVLATGPALAQDRSGQNSAAVEAQAVAGGSGVARFDAAMRLAEIGREARDPVLLVAAARAVALVGRTPGTDEGQTGEAPAGTKPRPAQGATRAETPAQDLVAQLLGEARLLAPAGDETVAALIAETEQSASRGTVAGPHTHDVRLLANRYYDTIETFTAGRLAEAAIAGDGDTDVDLEVYDQNGNLLCSSLSSDDTEYCGWTPAWTGQFRIRITNLGWVYNDVRLAVN
ncbi:hypothetical protein [Brevundimonas subvibrioides]|uniref:hypothetical protein n=1 Tax=Brevundimonas subvibrioides TaxID=74313 RepID=UPI0022B5B6DD|nr:hypothetical protein [Brevundimonas subvibrioides]